MTAGGKLGSISRNDAQKKAGTAGGKWAQVAKEIGASGKKTLFFVGTQLSRANVMKTGNHLAASDAWRVE